LLYKVATVGWVKSRREKSSTIWSQWGFWRGVLSAWRIFAAFFYKINSLLNVFWSI